MFGLFSKLSGLVWGAEEKENVPSNRSCQQHVVVNSKKEQPLLRKDFYGKVTRLYDSSGVIEDDIFFTFDSVIGGIRPEIGSSVHAEAWREKENSGWKAIRVQVTTDWDSDTEEIHNTTEALIGTITNITKDSGIVDNNITFKLSCVRLGYTPCRGDLVKLDLEKNIDGAVEVRGVMPLREKSFTGKVTSVSSGFGYIDDEVFFSCGVCSHGFRVCRGDVVKVTAVESHQDRATWRAIKVEPKRQSLRPSSHSQMFMGSRMAELISDKEGITVSEHLDFGDVFVGESKSVTVMIRNQSLKLQKLQSCISTNPNSQFKVHISNNSKVQPDYLYHLRHPSPPQEGTNSANNLCNEPSSVVSGLEIPPNQVKHIVVVLDARNLGRVSELLVFNFGGFEIGRFVTASIQDPHQEILKPCAPYQRQHNKGRDAWRKYSELNSGEECVIPGEKPIRKKKLFLPVKLAMYNIPKDIRRCIFDGRDLGSLVHSLQEPLSVRNYASKFSTLLYAEELQMEIDMRQFDLTKVSMNACGEFLSLQVSGLAEGRPSLLIGDKIVASLSGYSSTAPNYEGYIHEIHKDDIWLKFSEEFHQRFGMQECDVMFYFNRSTLRRCHRAVEFAVSLGEEVLFPRELSAKLPVLSLSFSAEQSAKEDKKRTTPGGSTNQSRDQGSFLYNKCLNERQRAAVCRIAGGQCRPTPYLLFGPPGTGKTITLVEAILQVFHGLTSSRILACAPSNSAADLIAERLHYSGFIQEGDMVRLNAAQRVQSIPDAISRYCTNTDELVSAANYRVIISTCSTAGQLYSLGLRSGHFTHVFVDEAGQATEPECLVALGLAAGEEGQVILAGDPFQLGPVLQSAISPSYGLDVSLLERFMSRPLYCRDEDRFSDHGCYDPLLVTKLVNNYRSHPSVLRLPSAVFYHDELVPCAEKQMRESFCQWSALPNKEFPVMFHGLKGEDLREGNSPSWFNPVEAVQVVKYVQSLRSSQEVRLKLTDIGVITPYRKQVEKLRLLLGRLGLDQVKVGSVEEFQGQERLAIIISTVRANESLVGLDVRHSVGFLSNPKRFNVAITRAQALLIVIGNPHVLCQDPYWCCLLQYCVMNDAYVGCDLPSLDQQILRNEFKAAMDLLSCAVGPRNITQGKNVCVSPTEEANRETTENQTGNTDARDQKLHSQVESDGADSEERSSVLETKSPSLDKSSIRTVNDEYETSSEISNCSQTHVGQVSRDKSKQAEFEDSGHKLQISTSSMGTVASNQRKRQPEEVFIKTAESEVQDDSDEELEEFVFTPRSTRESVTRF